MIGAPYIETGFFYWLFGLALVGLISIAGWAVYGLWLLLTRVSITVI